MSVYEDEKSKLTKLFENVEEDKRQLVQGLIEEAAFLYADNHMLKEKINECGGSVRFNPNNPALQKRTEAAKQFLSNLNTYSTVIRTLNGILQKNVIEDEDTFMKWLKEKMGFADGKDKETSK